MFADPIKAHAALNAAPEPVLLLGFVVIHGQGLNRPTVEGIVVTKDGSLSSIPIGRVSLDWRFGKDGKWDDLEGETIEEIDGDRP